MCDHLTTELLRDGGDDDVALLAARVQSLPSRAHLDLAFAVEGMGARVAMIELTDGPPHVLLTDHLDGDRTIYVYRVADLRKAVAALKKRGLKDEKRLEIPMGPCSSFTTPSGHRIALYEASRPNVLEHFVGRKDF